MDKNNTIAYTTSSAVRFFSVRAASAVHVRCNQIGLRCRRTLMRENNKRHLQSRETRTLAMLAVYKLCRDGSMADVEKTKWECTAWIDGMMLRRQSENALRGSMAYVEKTNENALHGSMAWCLEDKVRIDGMMSRRQSENTLHGSMAGYWEDKVRVHCHSVTDQRQRVHS